jgi:hypothetical protein
VPFFRIYRYQSKSPGDQRIGDLIFVGSAVVNEAGDGQEITTRQAALEDLISREGPLEKGTYFVLREEQTQWPGFFVYGAYQGVGVATKTEHIEVPPRDGGNQ